MFAKILATIPIAILLMGQAAPKVEWEELSLRLQETAAAQVMLDNVLINTLRAEIKDLKEQLAKAVHPEAPK